MDLIVPTDRGLYCEAGDFHIDPWRPVPRAVITHAPLRPRPLRVGALRLPSADRADPQEAPGRRRDRDGRIWRAARPQRRRDLASSRRPRARLGAGPGRAERRGLGRLGRLQGRGRRRRGRLRAAPLQRLHHRIRPSACRSTAGGRRPRSSPGSSAGGGRTPPRAARASSTPMRSARRSACSPASIPSIGPIVCHGAIEPINAIYREAGVAMPPTRLAQEVADKRDFAKALIVAPPSAAGEPVAEPLRRLFRRARERLDAGPGQPPPARPRPRLRAFRSRRLARAARRHRGDRRRARARDPRVHRRR